MKLPPYLLWTTRRNLVGQTLNGEIELVPPPFRGLADHLNRLPIADRQTAWNGFLASRGDSDAIVLEMAEIDPSGPAPETKKVIRRANLSDVRKVMSEIQWVWPGWIPASRLWGITGKEGIGKTRFAMDLARRIWNGEPWPDGQPPTFTAGTPTLWLCSDGQQDDLVAIANAYGMPDEAIIYNALPDAPYEGTTIDGDEAISFLEESIQIHRPAFAVIDSLTFATSRDLCQANHVKELLTPLRDVTQRTQTGICSLMHVSRDGEALGKRAKGLNRTILLLTQPDPDQPDRLKLEVSKSFTKKPPALGATMSEGGNDYDSEPPAASEPSGPGRPPTAKEKAKAFIRQALAEMNKQLGTSLRAKFKKDGGSPNTFDRAKNEMIKAGELAETGGTGTGEQWTLHLIQADSYVGEPAF